MILKNFLLTLRPTHPCGGTVREILLILPKLESAAKDLTITCPETPS